MCLNRLNNDLCEKLKAGNEPLTFYRDKKVWRVINQWSDSGPVTHYTPGPEVLKAINNICETCSEEEYTTGFHMCQSLDDLGIMCSNDCWAFEPIEVRVMPEDILHVGTESLYGWQDIQVIVADKMVVVREVPTDEWHEKLTDCVLSYVKSRMTVSVK